jgi:uncharacterized protein
MEWLTTRRPVELRASSGNSRSIGGYAAMFNRLSENLGGFVERVAPSFFNKSRADGWPGVIARYNHDDNYLLGATRSGTLQLSIDSTGLNYVVDLPESRNDVLEWVGRGDIGNSSFAFQTFEDDWSYRSGGHPMRTLVSGKLIDVAPVSTPAYRDTTVAMRSLAQHMGVPVGDIIELSSEDELRKLFVRTDRTAVRTERRALSSADAKARLMAKAPKPLSPVVAKMRLLAKKHPNIAPVAA